MSLESWKAAERPNYNTNEDLKYPYSELPYLPHSKPVKIPVSGLIEHVDYWGEGKITTALGSTGFRASYNVNKEYQLVSKGADRGKKIPNRVPVCDGIFCGTDNYIKDDSVKLVTVIEAPITHYCARDIARIVNKRVGMVFIYSKALEDPDVKTLISELKDVRFFYSPGYELTGNLEEPTLAGQPLVFLSEQRTKDILFKYVATGNYGRAVNLAKSLKQQNAESLISKVIDTLVNARESNLFTFADKLWNDGDDSQELVERHFPYEVKLITKKQTVKIISKYWNQALILDRHLDSNDRMVLGDSKDKSSNRISWKFIPFWVSNSMFFKIMNVKYSMFLKLNVNTDGSGDRSVWASNDSGEKRHLWKVTPVSTDHGDLYLIENYEYGQGIKLDSNANVYGDRQAWGHNGSVGNSPVYYGFTIDSWE